MPSDGWTAAKSNLTGQHTAGLKELLQTHSALQIKGRPTSPCISSIYRKYQFCFAAGNKGQLPVDRGLGSDHRFSCQTDKSSTSWPSRVLQLIPLLHYD